MTSLRRELLETTYAVGPVAACAAALLIAVGGPTAPQLGVFALGAAMTVAGLALFLEGVKIALLPVGESLGGRVSGTGSIAIVLGFGVLLGTIVTMAEPDVRILSSQLERADALAAPRLAYVVAVSVGVGVSMALALLRAVLDIALIPLMAVSYAIIGLLALISPSESLAHAFDFGAVTTGPVSVPMLLALNTGVVLVLGGQGDVRRSFGLLGIASIGPVVSVLLLAALAG